MSDIDQIQQAITAANLSWVTREPPPEEHHALGLNPSPPAGIARAEQAAAGLRQARMPALMATTADPIPVAGDGGGGGSGAPYPTSFDWRSRGVVGPVTNQEACGSCVSFATTGLVGAMADIELGTNNLWLSEADQHFESAHGPNCGGWNNHDSLQEVVNRGIVTENIFPYDSAFDDPRQTDPGDPNVWLAHTRDETFRDINTYGITEFTAWNGDDRKYYLATVGPMICAFTVYQDFDNYGGGPYRHVWGNARGGHAVLVVGYSDDAQMWICRNSWGDGFGGPAQPDGTGGGFFMLGYGECGIDDETFFGCHGVIPPAGRLHIGMAACGNQVYAVWKGEYGDDRLFFSSNDGSGWVPQQEVPGVGSSVGPGASPFNGQLYAIWKGVSGDQGIYWSSFDGSNWAPQQNIGGVASSTGPSLAEFNGALFAAWKGMDNDEGIYWSSFDGSNWAPQQNIGGVASSTGPSLAVFNGVLYAAWKGMGNDQRLWWSSFDGNTWAPQQAIDGVASIIGPTLAAFNGALYAGWRGMGDDQGIYWSSFDGSNWAPQQNIGGVASSIGPSLAAFNNALYAIWKGMDNDQGIWWSTFDGSNWAAQAQIPGGTCPD